METMQAVRGYTDTRIKPILDHAPANSGFRAESVPAFSARMVFDDFQQHMDQAGFTYKEASINPTNPRNQADRFEAELIQQLRSNRNLAQLSGYRTRADQSFFYIARPLPVTAQSCLSCHSTPNVAPKEQIKLYGAQHGFGWQLNTVVAAQIIYVPASEVFHTALRSFFIIMGVVSGSFVIVILLITLLLHWYVLQPVSILGRLAHHITNDEPVAEELESARVQQITERRDELGQLAQVFRAMAHEIQVRTQTLKEQVQQLRIEIDEAKRQQAVADIVESDYFKELQAKARTLRRTGNRATPAPPGQRPHLERGDDLPPTSNPAQPDDERPSSC
jgi:HAMP domain-containing protein